MNLETARQGMVDQLIERGVREPAVLKALRKVRREEFIDAHLRQLAYGDHPLPIAEEQTISQPYIVALMAQALELKPTDRVLEVGTGCGYAAAVLAEMAGQVFTIERYASLAKTARERLQKLGYSNIQVAHGDGTLGWPAQAPFDAITVAAAAPRVPPELLQQLKIGGRLVMPVGCGWEQELQRFLRTARQTFKEKSLGRVLFVPLIPDRDIELTPLVPEEISPGS